MCKFVRRSKKEKNKKKKKKKEQKNSFDIEATKAKQDAKNNLLVKVDSKLDEKKDEHKKVDPPEDKE